MSFLPIREENQLAPAGQTTNAPAAPPPASGGSAGAGETGGAATAPKGATAGSPTQFGSSASKLGDYLTANAPQITQQAGTLAGNLNQQYGNLSQGITGAANQFGQQVQGGYAAPNQELVSQAMQNPAAFAANPENVAAFQKQYNNQYTGPLSFEGFQPYADIQGQLGEAVQQGNLLSTPAGLTSYLRGQGPNPTKASATLDALLMQGNPEAQAMIRNAAGQFGNLPGQLTTATSGANQSVLDAQTAAENAQKAARQAVTGVVDPLAGQLTSQFSANQQAYGNRLSDLDKLYQTMNTPTGASITPEQTAAIGLQPGQFEQIQAINNAGAGINFPNFIPVNPGQFFTQNTAPAVPPTLASSASPEQIATMQALSQLTGGQYQAPFDLSQAYSTFNLPQAGSFDYEGAKTAGLQNLRGAYDAALQNAASLYPSDPALMSKLQSVQAYLSSTPDYSAYAPPPPSPLLQPVNPPPAGGGGGRVTY